MFQSLFYWILFFYGRENIWKKIKIKRFQSLFYWILFFYWIDDGKIYIDISGFNPYSTGFSSFIKMKGVIFDELFKFQSLFYWILFFYLLGMKNYIKILDVSILILLDSLLLFYESLGDFILTNKFQSLFYWILFFYPFYRADSLFLTLIEFFWEPNSIKINRYMTRFLLFFHLFP